MSNETIQSMAVEIAQAIPEITKRERQKMARTVLEGQLNSLVHEAKFDSLLAEAEAILSRYRR